MESFDIVAVNGNKVECCFDKVVRSFDNVVCCFDIVAGVDGLYRRQTTDDDRHQRQLLVWPPTLCVGGPVTNVQSNLTKGRIAVFSPLTAANVFVRRSRWAGTFARGGRRPIRNALMRYYVKIRRHELVPSKVFLPLDRFSRFCTDHLRAQHTERQTHNRHAHRHTDIQTTLRATSVAIGRISCTACRRCGLKMHIMLK